MPTATQAVSGGGMPLGTGGGADYRLEVVGSDAGFAALAPEWDQLWRSAPRPSPFLSHTWAWTWWRHFGRGSRLYLLLARTQGGELVGIAPLRIAHRRAWGMWPVRSLEFLGYRGSAVCTDHLDFLLRPDHAGRVLGALMAELARGGAAWDIAVLADLAQESAVPGAEGGTAAETCFFRALPPHAVELWAQLKREHPKLHSNLRYYRQRLERERGLRVVAPVPPEELEPTLEALARLHALAHARKGESGNFGRPEYRSFHQDLVRALTGGDELYLARLDCDGQAAAVLYGFVAGGTLYFYQSGFDPGLSTYGVGTLLLAVVMEDAIARLGLREFDFLRGGESYKTRWSTGARQTRTLRLWRPTAAARLSRWQLGAQVQLMPAKVWLRRRLRRQTA